MSSEIRLFLLITPPRSGRGPIRAECAIVGNADEMCGIPAVFSNVKELEQSLEAAGLPSYDVDRAIQRLEFDHPTFGEISHSIAENLRLIKRTGGPCGGNRQGMAEPARHSKYSAV